MNRLSTSKLFAAFALFLAMIPTLFVQKTALAQTTRPPVFVEIQDFQEFEDRFEFQVSLTDLGQVSILYVFLFSNNTRIGDVKEYDNPQFRIIRDQFFKSDLLPGRDYEIRIKAADARGELISLPSRDSEDRPVTTLETYQFAFEEEIPSPIEFNIRMMEVVPQEGRMRIELGSIDQREASRIQRIDGVIVDNNNLPVGNFQLDRPPFSIIDLPLPPSMVPSSIEQKFVLKLYILSVENLESEEEVYEITLPPAPIPSLSERMSSWWLRLLNGVEQEPWLFIGILVVLLNTVGWLLIRRGKRVKKTVFRPPPNDLTMPGIPSGVVSPPKSVRVEIIRTPDKRAKSKTFKKVAFSIGRHGTDMIINDDRISRQHLLVEVNGEKVQIQDCNSKNKTSIDGEQIEPGCWVDVGSMNLVQIGPNTEIKLAIQSGDTPHR